MALEVPAWWRQQTYGWRCSRSRSSDRIERCFSGSLKVWGEPWREVSGNRHSANEWFTLEASVVRQRYQVYLKGERVVDYSAPSGSITPGRIVLENYRRGTLMIRKLEVQPLRADGTPLGS